MLKAFEIFFGTDASVLADVAAASTEVRYGTEAVVLGQEDDGDNVYYVLEGQVKIVRYSSEGTEVWINEMGPGALFGEMTALGAKARTATIVAATDVTAAVFSQNTFLALLEKHGSIGLNLSRMLAQRIEHTTQRMFELAAFSSKGRVYAELLRQAKPIEDSDYHEIEKMPSMSAMARQLNNTRETVSRTVNELEKQGLIRRNGSKLTILKPEELRNMAS